MTESNDAALALIIDRLQNIDKRMEHAERNASMSRQRMYDKLDTVEREQDKAGARFEKLETAILTMSPTVAEFVALKTNAQVAGKLGRFLWRLGGIVLAIAAAVATMWAAFWTHFNWR